MKKNILFVLILTLFSSAFLVGCNEKETKTIDYSKFEGYKNDSVKMYNLINEIQLYKSNYLFIGLDPGDVFEFVSNILTNGDRVYIGVENIQDKVYFDGHFTWISNENSYELILKPENHSHTKLNFDMSSDK